MGKFEIFILLLLLNYTSHSLILMNAFYEIKVISQELALYFTIII